MSVALDVISRSAEAFAKVAQSKGYRKADPEDIVLPAQVTYDVQGGVAGSDTGSPATKQFFNLTSSDDDVQVQDPPIKLNQQLGGEFLLCVYAFALHFDAQGYAGTLTETREVQLALALATFWLTFGSDRVLTERGRKCTWFGEGLGVGEDGANGAGASLASRFEANSVDYHYMTAPRVLGSTQTLTALHKVSKATWTTDNDFNVDLTMKAWLARKG